MLSASHEQQQLLLEVSHFDSEITKLNLQLKQIEANSAADGLRKLVLESSEEVLQFNADSERIESEIKKLNADLNLVEDRIAFDKKRSQQVNNDRELKAIEHELSSLEARKSTLEDSELELMEELESTKAKLQELTSKRAKLSLELEAALEKDHAQGLNISANLSELQAKRAVSFAKLDAELAAVYERKASRGAAVAQTLGRDCSACRLAINGVEFDAMLSLPIESLPTCPNCDALIIR